MEPKTELHWKPQGGSRLLHLVFPWQGTVALTRFGPTSTVCVNSENQLNPKSILQLQKSPENFCGFSGLMLRNVV